MPKQSEARYKLVYEKTKGGGSQVVQYIPAKGHSLWKVSATYARVLKPSSYYVIARDQFQAKRLFMKKFSWISYISEISAASEEESDAVLNHVAENPQIII